MRDERPKQPKAAPENRRVKPPENRRSQRAAARAKPPLSARWVVMRERMRVRLSRFRWVLSLVLGAGISAAVLSGLFVVGKLVERHLRTSPAFATKTLEIEGLKQLSHAEVAAAAGLALGRNVFETSAVEATRRLLEEPWIEAATVRRRLPGAYEVEIRERTPVALLSLDRLYLLGEDGTAFKALGPGDPFDFPVITGIEPEDVQRDKKGTASLLASAIALLHEYQDAGLSRAQPISEIHVEPDGSLSLHVGGDPVYVRLGKPPFRTKLQRLRAISSELRSQKARAAYVYLDHERRPDRATVRLR